MVYGPWQSLFITKLTCYTYRQFILWYCGWLIILFVKFGTHFVAGLNRALIWMWSMYAHSPSLPSVLPPPKGRGAGILQAVLQRSGDLGNPVLGTSSLMLGSPCTRKFKHVPRRAASRNSSPVPGCPDLVQAPYILADAWWDLSPRSLKLRICQSWTSGMAEHVIWLIDFPDME